MIDRKMRHTMQMCAPSDDVGSQLVPESPKMTLRLGEGLRADAERCAKARGITLAEFIRQSVTHYVAWTAAQGDQNDETPSD